MHNKTIKSKKMVLLRLFWWKRLLLYVTTSQEPWRSILDRIIHSCNFNLHVSCDNSVMQYLWVYMGLAVAYIPVRPQSNLAHCVQTNYIYNKTRRPKIVLRHCNTINLHVIIISVAYFLLQDLNHVIHYNAVQRLHHYLNIWK